MRPACPQCFSLVEHREKDGLFSLHGSQCGWHVDGTVNRAYLPAIEPGPALVVKSVAPVSAATLKVIREHVAGASSMSLEELRSKLSGDGFWLGNVPAYQVEDLRSKLSPVGAWLEELPHEES